MSACQDCGQASSNRLCQECRLDDEHDFFERRAQEMLDAERGDD